MVFLALRRGHAQDQHVLRQPAFGTAHAGGDAQRKALLAQQRVAAVARAVRPDLARFGVVHDVFHIGVARPARLVFFARGQRRAHGVHARHEVAVVTQHVDGTLAHARHQLHVDGDIGRVGQLDADVGDGRAERAHAERDDVHGAAAHAAVKQRLELGAHFGRRRPVVGGAGVFLFFRADEGAVFDARNVGRVGPGQERARALGRVQLLEGAGIDQLLAQAVVFGIAAVAPVDALWLAQRHHVAHPGDQFGVRDVVGDVQVLDHPGGQGGVHRQSS